MPRDDFARFVKEALAKRVGLLCSNPECRKPTAGPHTEPHKALNIGVAAHITAASPTGPRYEATFSAKERRAAENGIWLCQTCAKLVDNDPNRYTPDLLKQWKLDAEELSLFHIGGKRLEPSLRPAEAQFKDLSDQPSFRHDGEVAQEFIRGMPTRWAVQVEAFLIQYLGLPGAPSPFGGRDADIASLNDWLTDPSGPQYAVLAARAGIGKSALLAHWAIGLQPSSSEYEVIYFPISQRWATNSESAFFVSLAFRLAVLHGEPLPRTDDLALIRDVIHGFLRRELPTRKRLLIIVDGLDEAAGWAAGPNLFPPGLSNRLRVIVAARPIGRGPEDWCARLGWSTYGVARYLSLGGLDANGIAGVLSRMGDPLATMAGRIDVINTLMEKSRGDPLIVGLYIEHIRSLLPNSAFDEERLAGIEPGIRGFFSYWMDDQIGILRANDSIREILIRKILALCALSLGPLSDNDILELEPGTFPPGALATTIADLQRLVVSTGSGPARGYVMGHPRFADFVREELLTADESFQLERRFASYGARSIASFRDGSAPSIPTYVVRWHAVHLDHAHASLAQFTDIIDRVWCEAWEKLEGTPAGFLSDLDRVWRKAVRPEDVAVRIRIAIVRSSIISRGRIGDIRIFQSFIRASLIGPALAQVIATHQEDADDTVRFLLVAADLLPTSRSELLRAGLDAIERCEGSWGYQKHLHDISTRMSVEDEQLRRKFTGYVLDAPCSAGCLAECLSSLAALATPEEVAVLAPIALGAARRVEEGRDRVWAILRVLDAFGLGIEEFEAELLADARAMAPGRWRAEALGAIARYCGDDGRSELLKEAGQSARDHEPTFHTALALSNIAHSIGEPHRSVLLRQAIDAGLNSGGRPELGVLADIAHQLQETDDELIRIVLDVALNLKRPAGKMDRRSKYYYDDIARDQSNIITALATRVDRPTFDRILNFVLSEPATFQRTGTLVALTRRLSTSDRAAIDRILALARNDMDPLLLSVVAALIEGEERTQVLEGAVTSLRTVTHLISLGLLLLELAGEVRFESVLSDEIAVQARRLGVRDSVVQILLKIAEHLPPRAMADLHAEAFTTSREIRDGISRCYALAELAQSADGTCDQAILQTALAAARAENPTLVIGPATCVGRLSSPAEATALLREGLTWLAEYPILRYFGFGAVAKAASDQGIDLRGDIVAVLGGIADEEDRSESLSEVAGYLASLGPLSDNVLSIARGLQTPLYRARTLLALSRTSAPEVREGLLAECHQATLIVDDVLYRAQLLAALASEAPADRRPDFMEAALGDLFKVDEDDFPSIGVDRISKGLHDHEIAYADRLLDRSRSIHDERYRMEALCALATNCRWHVGLVHTIVDDLSQFKDVDVRDLGFANLCHILNDLDSPIATRIVDLVTRISDPRDRCRALSTLAGHSTGSDRTRFLTDALASALEVERAGRIYALVDLSEQLRPCDADWAWKITTATLSLESLIQEQDHAKILLRCVEFMSPAQLATLGGTFLELSRNAHYCGLMAAIADRWLEFSRLRSKPAYDEFSEWLSVLSRHTRPILVDELVDLRNLVEQFGGQKAVSDMATAIAESGAWWR